MTLQLGGVKRQTSLVTDKCNVYDACMTSTAYLSNISPFWPFDRQEKALAAGLPGWPKGVRISRDDLDVRARRAHSAEALIARAAMLRASSRADGGEIYVATLAVLDWSVEGMLKCLTLAASRRSTVIALDAALRIDASAGAAKLHLAVTAFASARQRSAASEAGMLGGEISAKRRSDAAKVAAETIKAEWSMPSDEFPTLALLARAGISRNTANQYLGHRPVAQRIFQAALRRKKSP
jgi:hypothetical protein